MAHDKRDDDSDNGDGVQPSSLLSFSERVDKAKARHTRPSDKMSGRGSAIGLAYRLSMELVVGIVVGGFIGWWLDKVFGTSPLFLIIMLILGMVAGVVNMLRTMKDINKRLGLNQDEGDSRPRKK